MSRKEYKVVYAGKYSESKILSGPELTARSIFRERCEETPSVFMQYFFDGRKYSILKKLFGKSEANVEDGKILTLGLLWIIPELRKIKPDIIHLTTFERFTVIFLIYRMIFRVKILYNSHGVIQYENNELKDIPGFYKLKDKICEKLLLKYSDKIIFPSVNALDLAEKYYEINEENIIILPNGVNTIFFYEKIIDIKPNRFSAVIQHKNILNNSGLGLLFKALDNAELQMDVYIISEENVNIPQNSKIVYMVIPQMEQAELAEFYKDKDIFLSLNNYDTFSIATAEAMASGLIPVITTETGISRYIVNSVNGFTLDFHFSHDLLNILAEIINMPAGNLNNISGAAYDAMLNLKWNNVYEMYKPIYIGMLK